MIQGIIEAVFDKALTYPQHREVTPSPDWARFPGVLTSCLAKLVELYRDAMQEDPGDYDWSVLVKNAALGQVNEEIPPQVLLERVKQRVVGQDEALLDGDLYNRPGS